MSDELERNICCFLGFVDPFRVGVRNTAQVYKKNKKYIFLSLDQNLKILPQPYLMIKFLINSKLQYFK